MFHRLSSKLRIGERIGLGFGLVGLLLLIVIAQYFFSLRDTIAEYQTLQDVYEVKETFAQDIERELLQAGLAAKNFLLQRDEASAARVGEHIDRLMVQAGGLQEVDARGLASGEEIDNLASTYRSRFAAIAGAWRAKGLDHNSGLQGAFRDTVHELEERAHNYQAGPLYIQLLQIRRSEKDLGLRREPQYQDKVVGLLDEFAALVRDSRLQAEVQNQLLEEIEIYRAAFAVYAASVLANQDIQGGKGPFRQAAHRIEDILHAHLVPHLEARILQLRRREKDYLLRHDKKYVDMALQELTALRRQIDASEISSTDKGELLGLTENYQRDFLALVEQNDRIEGLLQEMQQAAGQIFPLVQETVSNANQVALDVTKRINDATRSKAQLLLWVSLAAAALGLLLTIFFTRSIARPVLRMAGFLDQLAHEEPTERIRTIPGARDELNAMAESVNQMADHKTNLIAWWKRSMEELQAERDALASELGSSRSSGGRPD